MKAKGCTIVVNANVGKRIREYRKKAHITQEAMAEALDISVISVSNIERGINYPTLENFIKIANIIGVSSDLLLSDVLEKSNYIKASELSERLKRIPPDKSKQITDIIEALLK